MRFDRENLDHRRSLSCHCSPYVVCDATPAIVQRATYSERETDECDGTPNPSPMRGHQTQRSGQDV
jgi:hypothetical protein